MVALRARHRIRAQPLTRTYLIHGRPYLPSPQGSDGEEVEIAAIHPDFV